jgi:hypothetical protein
MRAQRPTEEECWEDFWKILGQAAAERFLREQAEPQPESSEELGLPLAA